MDRKQAYAVGIDFGTQSGRAVLVELGTARELAASVWEYPHGVMDRALPDGQRLGADWALQHPADYLQVLEKTVPEVIRQGGISPEQVIGLGIDFTACTMLPAKADGRALCLMEEYAHRPHAWVKLWKHHAAQAQANRLNEIAQGRGEDFLRRYGGKISSEWMVPKVMQILDEDPAIYAEADTFVEAADWVVWQLTGRLTRNASMAGYKNLWNKKAGYPSADFFRALDPRMANFVDEKLAGPVLPQGAKAAGELCPGMAQRMGLMPGTAVAVANIDAHVTVPAVGITGTGDMLMIMGTSTCHILCGIRTSTAPSPDTAPPVFCPLGKNRSGQLSSTKLAIRGSRARKKSALGYPAFLFHRFLYPAMLALRVKRPVQLPDDPVGRLHKGIGLCIDCRILIQDLHDLRYHPLRGNFAPTCSPRPWAISFRRFACACAAWCFHNLTQAWGRCAYSSIRQRACALAGSMVQAVKSIPRPITCSGEMPPWRICLRHRLFQHLQ